MTPRAILTVVTPAATSALTSLDDAKDDIGITDTSGDAAITRLITRASGVISAYCNRVFGVEAVSETFRLAEQSSFMLPGIAAPARGLRQRLGQPLFLSRPGVLTVPPPVLTAVDSIDEALVEGTDYEIDYLSGLVYRLRDTMRSFWSETVVTVAYTSGFQLPQDQPIAGATALPPAIEDVCLALVRSAWYARGRDPNVAMDALHGDRTQFWDRSVGGTVLDDGLTSQLDPWVSMGR